MPVTTKVRKQVAKIAQEAGGRITQASASTAMRTRITTAGTAIASCTNAISGWHLKTVMTLKWVFSGTLATTTVTTRGIVIATETGITTAIGTATIVDAIIAAVTGRVMETTADPMNCDKRR